MQYYGTRLSENISRREPEGYLLCLNVPVARTGIQEYLPEELGLPSGRGTVPVSRTETEVFSSETIASFEGMPVTNDHPPDGVDIENIRRLQMGHAHNVRRGVGEESDLLLADLIITDPRLIDAILDGKREISCGYTYELTEENGQYYQRKIRGNHIAVVDAGRAGHRVSIKDKKPVERRKPVMKKPLSKILARMAKDGDVEEVAEIIEELIGETPETPAEAVAEAVEEVAEATAEAVAETVEAVEPAAETPATALDTDTAAAILERLDQLIALLTPPSAEDEDPDAAEEIAEAVEEVIEAVVAGTEEAEPAPGAEKEVTEILESILEPAVSTTLEEGETDENPENPEDPENTDRPCRDTLTKVLMAVRPALEEMTPRQRKKAARDIAARMPRTSPNGKDSVYAARYKPVMNYADLGRRIMAKRNPNYHD